MKSISNILFIFIFFNLKSSQMMNLTLISHAQDTKEFSDFRIFIGKSIKAVINEFLKNNPVLSRRLTQKIKVRPLTPPHYSHLYLGDININQVNNLIQIILNNLNNNKLIKNKLLVPVFKSAKLEILKNFIVLTLPNMSQEWLDIYLAIDNNSKKNNIEIEHFKKFNTWIPHISLIIINNVAILDFRDQKTGVLLKDLINKKLKEISNLQEKQSITVLDLSDILLTKKEKKGLKTEFTTIADFQFRQDTWKLQEEWQLKDIEDFHNLFIQLNSLKI